MGAAAPRMLLPWAVRLRRLLQQRWHIKGNLPPCSLSHSDHQNRGSYSIQRTQRDSSLSSCIFGWHSGGCRNSLPNLRSFFNAVNQAVGLTKLWVVTCIQRKHSNNCRARKFQIAKTPLPRRASDFYKNLYIYHMLATRATAREDAQRDTTHILFL